jgi:hypothetical protein
VRKGGVKKGHRFKRSYFCVRFYISSWSVPARGERKAN